MKLTKPGIFKVKHPERETPFMLSVVEIGGVYGVDGFEIGGKPKKRGKHKMVSGLVKEWVNSLEMVHPYSIPIAWFEKHEKDEEGLEIGAGISQRFLP